MTQTRQADSQEKEIRYISESETMSYVVYVLSKLNFSREDIVSVVKELDRTFALKCKISDEDRKSLLPTECKSDK